MTRKDFMKQHLRATLMQLCESTPLEKVTATQVIEAADVSRKSFYYHFADLDDLISFAAFYPLTTGDGAFFSMANFRRAWGYCVQHRAFFGQLVRQTSQNSYRRAFVGWLEREMRAMYAEDELSAEERAFRDGCVTLYCSGCVELLMRWLAAGLPEPFDVWLDATAAMAPPFLRGRLDTAPDPTTRPR